MPDPFKPKPALTPLDDYSKMPYGKHKGELMKNVPAQYLLWLWDNGVYSDSANVVHHYIRENLSSLEQDAPDYIVQHKPKK